MQDEKLCKHNQVISSQAHYISGIHKYLANTKTKRLHDQKKYNKILAQSKSHEKNSQKYDIFKQESLHSKCEHQSIILLQNNGDPDYILQWGIYKKSSTQFVLRVRDILHAIKSF